ncbi:unnamed protein product [Mytilus edulis]|uniref:TIR domain-containing protein n=1 Tax=Mytilus edulis TaxID=6550 RepID=A0A8S3RKU2_MYTED|nr:unnamed protein product [Mytilus edulis]
MVISIQAYTNYWILCPVSCECGDPFILTLFSYYLHFYGWFYFIVRYDLDNSTISVEVTDILRNSDHVLKPLEPFERTMSWEICRKHGSHSWTTTTGFDAAFEGNKMPICRSIYYRVEGEDVDITCKINNTFGVVDVKNGYKHYFIDFHVFNRFEFDLADVVMMIQIFFKVYCKVFVHHVAKIILKPKFPQSICDKLLPVVNGNIGDYSVEGNVTHDIMVVASDNDYDFVVQKLIPFFEVLGLSVLLPQTDINGGQSNINGYSQAVVTSVMYVVVGTRDFENDSWNNNFILSDLILPQMYEQQGHQHIILIMKFNDVNIPRPLRWNEHVTIADWSTRQSDDDNFRRLKNKLKSMTEALFMTEQNV